MNPQDPRNAVLERTLPWNAYRYVGLGLLAVGGVFPLWWLRFRDKRAFPWRIASGFLRLLGLGILLWCLCTLLLDSDTVRRVHLLGVAFLLAGSLLSLRPLVLRMCAVGLMVLGPLIALLGAFVSLTESGIDAIHEPGHALASVVLWLSLVLILWLLALLMRATASVRSAVRP